VEVNLLKLKLKDSLKSD